MRTPIVSLFAAIISVGLILPNAAPGNSVLEQRQLVHGEPNRSDRRVALVIGNGAYPTAPLKNPSNDATDLAAALGSLGFEVTLGIDWGLREMDDAIRAFGDRLKQGGVGLFYFAGHGLQVEGRNYLVPVGARIDSQSDVSFEAIDAGRVLGKMDDAGNGFNIVILDACRNNPFGRGFRSVDRGLAQVTAPAGSFIAYATSPGSVAADGDGRNGTFTAALLDSIKAPGLKLEDVFKRVRQQVASKTSSKQIPWDSSSLVGEFYFAGGSGSPVPASRPVRVPDRPVAETAARPAAPAPVERTHVHQGSVFTYELVRCRRSGPTVQCDIVVTNRFQDRRMSVYPEDCVAIDENGASYRVFESSVANRPADNYEGHPMLTGVRTAVVLRFSNVAAESREFKRVRLVVSAEGFPNRSPVEFADVRIDGWQ